MYKPEKILLQLHSISGIEYESCAVEISFGDTRYKARLEKAFLSHACFFKEAIFELPYSAAGVISFVLSKSSLPIAIGVFDLAEIANCTTRKVERTIKFRSFSDSVYESNIYKVRLSFSLSTLPELAEEQGGLTESIWGITEILETENKEKAKLNLVGPLFGNVSSHIGGASIWAGFSPDYKTAMPCTYNEMLTFVKDEIYNNPNKPTRAGTTDVNSEKHEPTVEVSPKPSSISPYKSRQDTASRVQPSQPVTYSPSIRHAFNDYESKKTNIYANKRVSEVNPLELRVSKDNTSLYHNINDTKSGQYTSNINNANNNSYSNETTAVLDKSSLSSNNKSTRVDLDSDYRKNTSIVNMSKNQLNENTYKFNNYPDSVRTRACSDDESLRECSSEFADDRVRISTRQSQRCNQNNNRHLNTNLNPHRFRVSDQHNPSSGSFNDSAHNSNYNKQLLSITEQDRIHNTTLDKYKKQLIPQSSMSSDRMKDITTSSSSTTKSFRKPLQSNKDDNANLQMKYYNHSQSSIKSRFMRSTVLNSIKSFFRR